MIATKEQRTVSEDLASSVSPRSQRFDDSFVIHMIRDFFLVLLGVIVIELGIRFAMVLYEFHTHEKEVVQTTAERLASDVKSIMLNRGGPVAARTVYPILRKNHDEIGLAVAIKPSQMTTDAIEDIFKFVPKGIPAEWPEGQHQAFKVEILAEEFCIQCHITAKPGDVLGQVEVRSYLGTQLHHWWDEVKLATTLGMGKILLHTVILFFLLKARMEPLLSLQSMIAVLAKSGTRLSHRAPVKSHDEFGELARDLNLFLDRVSQILDDLGGVLTKIVALNQRLTQVHEQMAQHFRTVGESMSDVTKQAFEGQRGDPVLSEEWVESIDAVMSVVQAFRKGGELTPKQDQSIERIVSQLREYAHRAQTVLVRYEHVGTGLIDLSGNIGDFSHWLEEMGIIEEKMQGISEQGHTLLGRLQGR